MADETPKSDIDIDELLALGTPVKPKPANPVAETIKDEPAPPNPAPVVEERALTKPAPVAPPAAEHDLTPDQKRIRELEHRLALQETAKLDAQVDEEIIAEGESTLVIHFVLDGFTTQGRVWYRGQEMEFDARTVQETRDVNGVSWLSYDEAAQYDHYGRVFFKRGPWPGKEWDNAEAAAKEAARRRAVPVPTRS